MLRAAPLWFSLQAFLRCFGMVDLQHKAKFTGVSSRWLRNAHIMNAFYLDFLEEVSLFVES